LVITHITVIDGTGAPPKPDMTLVVTGSRITALGKTGTVKIPEGAQKVESQGKFLIPVHPVRTHAPV
jgi:imidazolonepropionase-like amidohydrolase